MMTDEQAAAIAAIKHARLAALTAIESLDDDWPGEWPTEIVELVIGAYVDLRSAHNLAAAITQRPDPDLIAECMEQTR
jgi:hypothetical protein